MMIKILFSIFFFSLSLVASSSQAESPQEETVILLHGLGRTHRSMKSLEQYLKKKGYLVHNLKYPSTKKTVQELSDEWLSEVLKTTGREAKKIHFIGHSLGGLLVRYYLQENEIPNLGRIVMLAPPNQGSHVTDKIKDWFIYESSLGPAGQQLGTGPEDLPKKLKPVEAEIGVIAGNRSGNLLFSLMIPGPDDGKVSVECTKLKNMKDFLVLPLTHTFIMQNSIVHFQAEFFLQFGRFDHS